MSKLVFLETILNKKSSSSIFARNTFYPPFLKSDVTIIFFSWEFLSRKQIKEKICSIRFFTLLRYTAGYGVILLVPYKKIWKKYERKISSAAKKINYGRFLVIMSKYYCYYLKILFFWVFNELFIWGCREKYEVIYLCIRLMRKLFSWWWIVINFYNFTNSCFLYFSEKVLKSNKNPKYCSKTFLTSTVQKNIWLHSHKK